MKNNNYFTLLELSQTFNASFVGEAQHSICTLASLENASSDALSYINQVKHLSVLAKTKAGVVIISPELATHYNGNKLLSQNPELLFAKCSTLFNSDYQSQIRGIARSAIVEKSANIHPSATIGDYCIIGKNTTIQAGTTIKPYCLIEAGVSIGKNSLIESHCSIQGATNIGNNTHIKANCTIGSQGFGNVLDDKKHWHSIHHIGSVCIGNNVCIGANTTIDRGRFEETTINQGVRLDNLIHIAHNVNIGAHTAIAAGTKIAGSTKIGQHCLIGGMVGIENHLTIANEVIIYSGSIVRQDIKHSGRYSASMPVTPHKQWLKIQSRIKKLDKMYQLFNTLKAKL